MGVNVEERDNFGAINTWKTGKDSQWAKMKIGDSLGMREKRCQERELGHKIIRDAAR